MPIKFLVLGGGLCFFGRGGVEVPIIFLWAWGFFRGQEDQRFSYRAILLAIVSKNSFCVFLRYRTTMARCCKIRSPRFGVGRKGPPRFVPISPFSSDLFRFVPICVPCLWEYPDLFRSAPICSDFFRLFFRTNQNKSGKPLSADLFP